MLSSITVRNLSCFDDQDYKVTFNKLNVIVGTNNSGKSTLFRGMNLLRWYATTNSFSWSTPYFQLVQFSESVYGHDMDRDIKIEVEYSQGSNKFQGVIGLNHTNNISQSQFLKNHENYGDFFHPTHKDFLKKIWYFSPNRLPISFRERVGIGGDALQPLHPSGNNIKQFLIERWTSQDKNWELSQEWFKKVDPQLMLLKTPLYGDQVGIETERNDGNLNASINISLQGSGMQNVATIISAIIFSPKGSTIIIEEPENYLNSRTIETLVDLFNYAVNELDKQVIIATHSWDIIKAYCSDIGEGEDRGHNHIKANPDDFKLIALTDKLGGEKIIDYDISDKKFTDVRKYFKELWG